MSTPLKNQKSGSQLQTKLPTKSEAGFFRGMLWSGACFLTALAVLVIQQVLIASTLSAHLESGGIDDPDAVFGHFNPLILLAPFAMVICALGLIVCSVGWLVRKCQRQRRMRNHLNLFRSVIPAGILIVVGTRGIAGPASDSDRNFATGALVALGSYDSGRIGTYTSGQDSEFTDLRPYYGWFTHGVDPTKILFLGRASQRKRYLHVECEISDRVSPTRVWNNYLLELRDLDGRTCLSKIAIPGNGIRIPNPDANLKEIAETLYRSQETNPDASTRVDILCQEKLCESMELKAYRCSLVSNRLVHDLRIPTYVDAVIYLIHDDTGFKGYMVHLADYEMARIKASDQADDRGAATTPSPDKHQEAVAKFQAGQRRFKEQIATVRDERSEGTVIKLPEDGFMILAVPYLGAFSVPEKPHEAIPRPYRMLSMRQEQAAGESRVAGPEWSCGAATPPDSGTAFTEEIPQLRKSDASRQCGKLLEIRDIQLFGRVFAMRKIESLTETSRSHLQNRPRAGSRIK